MLEEMKAYFKELGFDNLCYATGDGSEVYSDLRGVYVHLHPKSAEVEIVALDDLIRCTTGRLGFPNPNIPMFLRQIDRHRPLADQW